MNKSMLIGVVAGIGVAMAGGVAAYTFLGNNAEVGEQRNVASTPGPVKEECWNEEVAVQTDPKDPHRIAGTVGGAVVGGAIGKDVGDRDLTTAAGAAVGAIVGRKIQEEIQENRAEERTTKTIERRCAPVGSR